MSKPHLLVNCPINSHNRQTLPASFELHFIEEASERDTFLDAIGDEVQAIISDGPRDLGKEVFDRLPKLALIVNLGVGVDKIDLVEAERRGIVVTNARGTNAPSVADHAFALLLAVVRYILPNDRSMRANHAYDESPKFHSDTISGKTLGVLGMGAIGSEIAKRAAAFDMEIFYHNRRKRDDVPYTYCEDVVSLANQVRYLMVSIPGGPETHHLVKDDVLQALGPDGVLINVARGSVTDTGALVRALKSGTIRGAGLDVVDGDEVLRQPLCDMDNVVMTPHLSGNTVEAIELSNALAAEILDDFFQGRPVKNRIV